MRRGALEVIVVHAEGITHTNLVGNTLCHMPHWGRPAYYVVIQCGAQEKKSKVTSRKGQRTRWNEKFIFEFPLGEWEQLTHIKFRIMDTKFFKASRSVGETIIYLGGIVAEGVDRGFLEMKPTSYNVVLEDDRYKGEIKIRFKFIIREEKHAETRFKSYLAKMKLSRQSVFKSILKMWKCSWW